MDASHSVRNTSLIPSPSTLQTTPLDSIITTSILLSTQYAGTHIFLSVSLDYSLSSHDSRSTVMTLVSLNIPLSRHNSSL